MRDKSRGGGVLIAVRKTLISSEIFKSNDTELLAVKIHHNHRPTVLAAYYRPPTKPKTITLVFVASPQARSIKEKEQRLVGSESG
jgi:hypothetical protein